MGWRGRGKGERVGAGQERSALLGAAPAAAARLPPAARRRRHERRSAPHPHPPDCWPTQATICAMLMGDPFEPHWLMMSGELWKCSVFMHT